MKKVTCQTYQLHVSSIYIVDRKRGTLFIEGLDRYILLLRQLDPDQTD